MGRVGSLYGPCKIGVMGCQFREGLQLRDGQGEKWKIKLTMAIDGNCRQRLNVKCTCVNVLR